MAAAATNTTNARAKAALAVSNLLCATPASAPRQQIFATCTTCHDDLVVCPAINWL